MWTCLLLMVQTTVVIMTDVAVSMVWLGIPGDEADTFTDQKSGEVAFEYKGLAFDGSCYSRKNI